MNIIEALHDDRLFKPAMGDLRSWAGWEVVLKAIFAIPMTAEELEFYRRVTGRSVAPVQEARESYIVAGRRSGKSRVSALIAVYLGLFVDYTASLAAGERGSIIIVAGDKRQARTIFNYCSGFLNGNPTFKQSLVRETQERIELTGRVDIEILTSNFRTLRGRTAVAVVGDECAFWHSDEFSRNPDVEIRNALLPSMATIQNSKAIFLSSPYSRRGILWGAYSKYFGVDGSDVLVVHAKTRDLNPRISQAYIDRELEKSDAAARSEWLAEWRLDIETFLSVECVKGCCVLPGDLAFQRYQTYKAFVDASGGRQDKFGLAIGHFDRKRQRYVVDLLSGWSPPFDPYGVVSEIVKILRDYRINSVCGDRFGGDWVSKSFANEGISYNSSEKSASDLYINLEPHINVGDVEIPENDDLITELLNLERHRGKAGKDKITHPIRPGAHDDLANCVAGVVYELVKTSDSYFSDCNFV